MTFLLGLNFVGLHNKKRPTREMQIGLLDASNEVDDQKLIA